MSRLVCFVFLTTLVFASELPKDKDPYHPTSLWKAELDKISKDNKIEPQGEEKWREPARAALEEALKLQELNQNVAKNIIIFIGDGMGVSTVSAARILEGGEKHQLSFEKFPHHALSKTYAADFQTTDSAASATAILCGIKNNQGTLAVNDKVVQGTCMTEAGNEVDSILYKAQRAGKSTGVVTNTAITHATPAAAYANSVMRAWENDADMRGFPFTKNCRDIARQLIENGTDINVILGGGRSNFIPREMADPVDADETGDRRDERDLIGEWEEDKANRGFTYQTIYNKTELFNVDTDNTDFLFGLFSRGHMSYETDKDENHPQPNLAEMVQTSLDILQKNEEGYFLLVEGGKIDHAHHASRAGQALVETVMFSKAVETAVNATSESDTLIIVTADHSHTLAFGGYSARGNHILGKSILPAADNWPYTTLTYGNGPGFNHTASEKGRENLRNVDTVDPQYVQQSPVPKGEETHAGEDVSIYASGPMAHLFHGVHESHYIPYVAEYAACIGDDLRHCSEL